MREGREAAIARASALDDQVKALKDDVMAMEEVLDDMKRTAEEVCAESGPAPTPEKPIWSRPTFTMVQVALFWIVMILVKRILF